MGKATIHTGDTVRSPYWSKQADRVFYVSVKDGSRKGILLGPYETHQEALDNVKRGQDLAEEHDPSAAFYSYGTCSAARNWPLKPAFR